MEVKKYEEKNLSAVLTAISGVRTTVQQVEVVTDEGESFKLIPTDNFNIDPRFMFLLGFSSAPKRK